MNLLPGHFLSWLTTIAALTVGTATGASVTLIFSTPPTTLADGFADRFGTPTNGLVWGVLVDVGGDGFALGDEAYRSGFEVETPSGILGMPQVVEIVPTSTSLSGDILVIPSTSTLDSSPFGGTGTITTSFVPFENGIATDAAFAIFWFDVVQMSNQSVAEGTSFGILEDPLFTIPEAGFTVDYAAVFGSLSGPFPASSGTFGPVPEPTTPVLLTATTAALALRRRRTDRLSHSAQTC